MTGFGDVLTVLSAGGGLTVLLIMAAVPLLLDHEGDGRVRRTPTPTIRSGPRASGARAVGRRA